MIPTQRSEPIEEPIRMPTVGLGGIIWLSLFSVLHILVNISGCVCLSKSTAVSVAMVSISSFPGFGAKCGLQNPDSAKKVPPRDFTVIDSQLTPFYRQKTSRDILCNDLWLIVKMERRAQVQEVGNPTQSILPRCSPSKSYILYCSCQERRPRNFISL